MTIQNADNRKYRMLITVVFLSIIIFSCGPTKEELEEIEKARKEAEIELLNLKAEMKKSAHERAISDTNVPPDVVDPGYEVADCYEPKLPDETSTLYVPGAGKFVCGNTKSGSKIVDKRKWYCQGVKLSRDRYVKCVLSEWKEGEPTFGSIIKLGYKSAMAFEGATQPVRVGISPFRLDEEQ